MPLIDDIEFYGRAVAAGELTRERAAELLARGSGGFFTVPCAASWLDGWEGARARLDRLHSDVFHAVKAIENGRAVQYRALPPKLPAWEESPAESARADRDYWVDRDWPSHPDDPSDHYYC